MKITLDLPDGTTNVGVFVNFHPVEGSNRMTTTNAIIDTALYRELRIDNNAYLTFKGRSGIADWRPIPQNEMKDERDDSDEDEESEEDEDGK